MQCAPLCNLIIRNIYKEWVGTSWPYVQLQEAIRTAKVFESGSGFGMCPKSSLSNLPEQLGTACILMFECNSSMQRAPLWNILTFWIFTRIGWGPADHMCSCKKQSEQPKSLRTCSGLAMRPKLSLSNLPEQFDTACIWMFETQCNISMQCAPYVQLQDAIRTAKFKGLWE